jgi:hypothetical protein
MAGMTVEPRVTLRSGETIANNLTPYILENILLSRSVAVDPAFFLSDWREVTANIAEPLKT